MNQSLLMVVLKGLCFQYYMSIHEIFQAPNPLSTQQHELKLFIKVFFKMAYQSAFGASNQTHVNSEFDKHKKHLGAKKVP